MIEDDVLAREDWYPSAIRALESIEFKRGHSDLLYLRMFYTEPQYLSLHFLSLWYQLSA